MLFLQTLVRALKAMEEDQSVLPQEYLTNGTLEDLHPKVRAVVEETEHILSGTTHPTLVAMQMGRLLAKDGYKVTPGDQDSFGWLTGCIHTTKGIVVFG